MYREFRRQSCVIYDDTYQQGFSTESVGLHHGVKPFKNRVITRTKRQKKISQSYRRRSVIKL